LWVEENWREGGREGGREGERTYLQKEHRTSRAARECFHLTVPNHHSLILVEAEDRHLNRREEGPEILGEGL